MISKYEKGYPCTLNGAVGRLVGESDGGSWGEINGIRVYSIPLFSTPHGTVLRTGVYHLNNITEDEMKRLLGHEEELKAKNEEMYAGYLN